MPRHQKDRITIPPAAVAVAVFAIFIALLLIVAQVADW